jgi:hypothetical protein
MLQICSSLIKGYLKGDASIWIFSEFVAACKALGIKSYFIKPLWCLVKEGRIHIPDIGKYYKEFVLFVDSCVEDTESLIEGSRILSFSQFVEDPVYQNLIKPWEYDGLAAVILKPVLTNNEKNIF